MMRGRRMLFAVVAVAVAAGVAGCGEKAAVTVYKQGKYQGKPDKQPWENDQFKSDRLAWEKTIKARSDGQNEYTRVSAQ